MKKHVLAILVFATLALVLNLGAMNTAHADGGTVVGNGKKADTVAPAPTATATPAPKTNE